MVVDNEEKMLPNRNGRFKVIGTPLKEQTWGRLLTYWQIKPLGSIASAYNTHHINLCEVFTRKESSI